MQLSRFATFVTLIMEDSFPLKACRQRTAGAFSFAICRYCTYVMIAERSDHGSLEYREHLPTPLSRTRLNYYHSRASPGIQGIALSKKKRA